MADLIAIGYPDKETAGEAMSAVERLRDDLAIEADAVASVIRQDDGTFKVSTTHGPSTGDRAAWGMFWGLLFGILFFVPLFGMAVGAGLGALLDTLERLNIDTTFQEQVRGMVKPGTSALFLLIEKAPPDKAIEGLRPFGGTVLKTSLSEADTELLQEALHGRQIVTV